MVIPVLNEEHHLRDAVDRVLDQDFSGPLEVVLALGPSKDQTDQIAAKIAQADPRVRLVANPSGRTPAGLNAAIAQTKYDLVVRIDGHALIPRNYLSVAEAELAATGADNVGGVMAAEGVSDFQKAVARAMTTRLGVGAASFHVGGQAGPTLTVYLGAFRAGALQRVGGYDETFQRAQDWEMNHRIRATGGLVWFTPQMRVTYRPRRSPKALAKQYFNYGRWRRVLARRYPETVSVRYLAAPAATLGVVGGLTMALASRWGPRWLAVGAAAPAGYSLLVVAGSVANSAGLPIRAKLWLPVVYATMHHSWGLGFLTSPPGLGRE
ncbi:glycosyltransferase family 2 protein [Candidatus Nanopelagicales bacterium]|nr:glycosyltransferase family 2 protein [Candidatus Nanopelagicales bacterium]